MDKIIFTIFLYNVNLTTMQNALQNPHYKKIWEEINWKARHPEAESLEEALEMEGENPLCIIYSNNMETITAVDYAIHGSYMAVNNKRQKNGDRILGRQITLEDILMLFDGKTEYQGIQDGYHIFGNTIHYTNDTNSYIEEHFRLKIKTLFEEQTPETWEKIANLILYICKT
jgi:hypothetical protein